MEDRGQKYLVEKIKKMIDIMQTVLVLDIPLVAEAEIGESMEM